MKRFISVFAFLFVFTFVPSFASTITATTSVSQMSYLDQASPTVVQNGGDRAVFGGFGSSDKYRTVLKTTMPTFSGTVTEAKLWIYCANPWTQDSGVVYELTNSYTPTQATWNKRNSSTNWSSAGGDYGPELGRMTGSGCTQGWHSMDIATTTGPNSATIVSGGTVELIVLGKLDGLGGISYVVTPFASGPPGYPYIEYTYDTSGGGGSPTSSAAASSSLVIPATLYSSRTFVNPATTTTFSFSATDALPNTGQAGVVFITHGSSSVPVVSWGGVTMTRLDYTADQLGFITSAYIVNNPATSSVTITSIVASSTYFIYVSVWNNATVFDVSDTRNTTLYSSKAYVDLPTIRNPSRLVGALFSPTSISEFTPLATNNELVRATSSSGGFGVVLSTCYSASDDCSLGYTKNIPFLDVNYGEFVGFSLYATTSVEILASTTPTTSEFFGELGTTAGFQACGTFEFGCVFKNLMVWLLGLIVPSTSDIASLQEKVVTTLSASSSLASAIFLVPLTMSLYVATSTRPTASTTPLTLGIPKADGGVDVYPIRFVSSPSWVVSLDGHFASILYWIFSLFTVFFVGKLFIRLFHI